MRVPVVSRVEHEAVCAERDAWRLRAEAALTDVTGDEPPTAPPARRWRGRAARPLVATSLVAAGLAVGTLGLSGSSNAVSVPDYPGCIGKARYEEPIAGNQYQELVNALYRCGVYTPPTPG